MYKLQNELINLLSNSCERLGKNIDKNIIRKSIQYDIYKTAFKCNIALKIQVPVEQILSNINITNCKYFFKEATVKNNYIYFFLNSFTKYQILDNIFNDVITNMFGYGNNKQLIINIQYQHKNNNSLSFFREQAYYIALINLYKVCGYTVHIAKNNVDLSDYMLAYNMLKSYISKEGNISYLHHKIFMCDNKFTQYASYICNYVVRYINNNQKSITICSKPYSLKNLKYFDKLLHFKYSILMETEPVTVYINNKLYNSNDLQYYDFNYINEFKYSCMEHKVNQKYKFDVNSNKLAYILKLKSQVTNLIKNIVELNIINNYWYTNNTWRIFKNDEIILNYISQLNNVLNFASKEIKLQILANYLFRLCHLAQPIIASTNFILKNDNVDSKQLKSKLKILIIIQYTIKFILDIFEIRG